MPNKPYTYEVQDGDARIAVDVDPTADRPIRVRVVSVSSSVGAVFEMSVVGTQRLNMVLSSALSRAINHGLA